MMKGVRRQAVGAERPRESRVRLDEHLVHAIVPIATRIVVDTRWALTGNVLNEGATERHVHHLYAATDGERGKPTPSRLDDQRDLAFITAFVDLDGGVWRLSVTGRGNVLAACDDETGYSVENGTCCHGRQRGDNQWHETNALERIGVRGVHTDARCATNDLRGGRHADER